VVVLVDVVLEDSLMPVVLLVVIVKAVLVKVDVNEEAITPVANEVESIGVFVVVENVEAVVVRAEGVTEREVVEKMVVEVVKVTEVE
jgi:hypothetical protein